ncbi:TorD/DmsD family molecular chaperone [Halomonas sp. V046]|uniref:TorD/DmsD family molecular chaperone n=1 Tax=Halomonas sp. V046 TaxID=3459611 RepID=UPI004044688E
MTDLAPDASTAPEASTDDRALRADIYGLIAALLRAPPEPADLAWLGGLEIDDDGSALAMAWRRLARCAAQAEPEDLPRAHFRHLIGVIQGDVLPYASYYRDGALMETSLVALRQDLKALGIARSPGIHDPEDHLAALCDVMAILIMEGPSAESAFFHRHLAPWAGRCLADLALVDTPFYAALGELGKAYIDDECERLGAATESRRIRLIPTDLLPGQYRGNEPTRQRGETSHDPDSDI